MAPEVYEALQQEPGILGELARLGRQRREAEKMAEDEYLDGLYADETELQASHHRMAASDTATVTVFGAGPYELTLTLDDDGASVVQRAGPAGATLVVGDAYLTLEPGRATPVPLSAMPERLVVLGPRGRRWRLLPV